MTRALVENFRYDAVSAERWARSHAAVFSVNGTVARDEAEAAIDLVAQALDVAWTTSSKPKHFPERLRARTDAIDPAARRCHRERRVRAGLSAR